MQNTESSSQLFLPRPVARARQAVLTSYALLILHFAVLSYSIYERATLAAVVIWLVQVLPLLIFARSLYLTQLRTYGWLCFVVLLYFIHAVLVAFEPERRIFGMVEIILCSALFVSLVLFIRGYKNHFQVNM